MVRERHRHGRPELPGLREAGGTPKPRGTSRLSYADDIYVVDERVEGVVVIGTRPQDMTPRSVPVIYFTKDRAIFASGRNNTHAESSSLAWMYLYKGGEATYEDRDRILGDSLKVRTRTKGPSLEYVLLADEGEPEATKAIEALAKLGVRREQITASRYEYSRLADDQI